MGSESENITGLAPHTTNSTSTGVDFSYQMGRAGSTCAHEFSPGTNETTAKAVWAEADTSETAWLDEMPGPIKNWMNSRPAAERVQHRECDKVLHNL